MGVGGQGEGVVLSMHALGSVHWYRFEPLAAKSWRRGLRGELLKKANAMVLIFERLKGAVQGDDQGFTARPGAVWARSGFTGGSQVDGVAVGPALPTTDHFMSRQLRAESKKVLASKWQAVNPIGPLYH